MNIAIKDAVVESGMPRFESNGAQKPDEQVDIAPALDMNSFL
jgi:hypothetical protein